MVKSKIQGPTTLDPNQTYTVTNRDGATFTGGGAQSADWANYWADDPTTSMFSGHQTATSSNPGRDVFSNFGGNGFGGGSSNLSLEQVVRHFAVMQSRVTPRTTPGPNDGEEEPEAQIVWGGPSDFYEDGQPTDPVEDIEADSYVESKDTLSGQNFLSEGMFRSLSAGGSGGLGVPAGSVGIPKKRKPQDRRPGVRTYEEMDRQVQRGMVFNPKDREQWVIVERVMSMRFRGPDGVIMKLNFKPPPFPPSPEDPVTPP